MRLSALVGLALAATLGTTGCLDKMILEGTIASTRTAASSFDTLGDYEVARSAASAGIAQFEGMHRLAPKNADALFLLTQSWAGYASAFAEDDYELAQEAGDEALATYHKKRARMAYDRAIFYGLELLALRDDGFPKARKNAGALKAWLASNFTKRTDAEDLFWLGLAWLAKTDLFQDESALVPDLFVAEALLERSLALDPGYMHHSATIALGGYHARAGVAEVEQAKTLFESALAKTQRKALLAQVTYARTYACLKADRPLYEKLLTEVLSADDPDPEQRLNNTVAKRQARRLLSRRRMMDCGMDMTAGSK